MRGLESRVSRIERQARPRDGITYVVNSRHELKQLLKENPEIRTRSILIAPKVNKPPYAGTSSPVK